MRRSVAMTGHTESRLTAHLLREDGNEDLCFATWRPSTGHDRLTAILGQPILPNPGDRHVHGNVSFAAAYALRAAQEDVHAHGNLPVPKKIRNAPTTLMKELDYGKGYEGSR